MSDIDERLEEEIIHASRKSFDSQEAGMNANFLMELQSEIERLRADLAAVTEERDRLQIMHDEAYISGMKHGWNCCAAGEEERYKNSIENIREQIRRARAALEGVTEPLATHKEPDEHLNLRNAECLPSTVAAIKPEPPR